jgi:hypothetical protein
VLLLINLEIACRATPGMLYLGAHALFLILLTPTPIAKFSMDPSASLVMGDIILIMSINAYWQIPFALLLINLEIACRATLIMFLREAPVLFLILETPTPIAKPSMDQLAFFAMPAII